MIRKEGTAHVVRSRKGKKLGEYNTRKEAAKRLQQSSGLYTSHTPASK